MNTEKHFQQVHDENREKSTIEIFLLGKPSLLFRGFRLSKNILLKDLHPFEDRIIFLNEKLYSLFGKICD